MIQSNFNFACIEKNAIRIAKFHDLVYLMHQSETANVKFSGQCFKDMDSKVDNWPYALFV